MKNSLLFEYAILNNSYLYYRENYDMENSTFSLYLKDEYQIRDFIPTQNNKVIFYYDDDDKFLEYILKFS